MSDAPLGKAEVPAKGPKTKPAPGDILARFGKAVNPFAEKSYDSVGGTAEFKRIYHLPRRSDWVDMSGPLTKTFALQDYEDPKTWLNCPVDCVCGGLGYMKLKPRQGWALAEFFDGGGGVAMLGPGEGKTLVSLLIALLAGWVRPLLLVPASLRDKTIKVDMPQLRKHWRLPTNLDVRSYEEMSLAKFADYLSVQRIPDAVIADECHNLKNRASARTKRLLRFFMEHPETQFVVMSGSIVHRSIMDYGHLTLLALKNNAPLPHSFMELRTWADALDEGVAEAMRPKPGALLTLVHDEVKTDPQLLVDRGMATDFAHAVEQVNLERARAGYQRRLLETPAVISSPDLSTQVGLIINEVKLPPPPKDVLDAFMLLRNDQGTLPNGDMCASALDQNRHAKTMLLGLYYRWAWPDGKIDLEWLEARRMWKMFVRQMTTRTHGGKYYDTEFQVANGVRKRELVDEGYDKKRDRRVSNVYGRWVEIRDDRKKKWGSREPPKVTEWLSDYAVNFVEEWIEKNNKPVPGARGGGAIVWVESRGFLEKMRERGHICYGAGQNGIMNERGDRTVIASMAHSVGKNLQMFSRCLFTSPLSSGKANEQALARLHRPGQTADDVIVDVILGCRESWWSFFNARRDARYIEQTLGQRQRLNQATIDVTLEMEVCERFDAGNPLWAATGFAKMDDKATVQDVIVHAESDDDDEMDNQQE